MKIIDIILPIYNSPKETQNCIESIINNTPESSYRLFLFDDCSTDTEVVDIGARFSRLYKNIFYHRNKTNKGFPENVNNGLKITTNDVVILNSDTLVTKNWLKELYLGTITNKKIAAVGPLSNYGIVTSVPTIYQEINDTFDINLISQYLEQIKEKKYHETPVLIGFCMYLTRDAINNVGLLDSQTFKKGYGEETDWCLRARKLGYKLLIAERSYVFHVGGVSFGTEKKSLRVHAKNIIQERYPDYHNEIIKLKLNHPLNNLRKKMSKDFKISYKYRFKKFYEENKLRLKVRLNLQL